MREQILKLCRRLDNFTIDNLLMITEMESEELLPIVRELLAEGKISESNGQYSYCKKVSVMSKYSIFSCYNPEIVDIVIRCFCTAIPSYKVALILGIGEKQAVKLYTIFREAIYNEQLKRLNFHYELKPQQARNRIFFEAEAYFYVYDNHVYVSEKLLHSKNDIGFTSAEVKEFKKIYCYLTRCAYHNQNKHHLGSKLAEFIWRREQNFKELYLNLKTILT